MKDVGKLFVIKKVTCELITWCKPDETLSLNFFSAGKHFGRSGDFRLIVNKAVNPLHTGRFSTLSSSLSDVIVIKLLIAASLNIVISTIYSNFSSSLFKWKDNEKYIWPFWW